MVLNDSKQEQYKELIKELDYVKNSIDSGEVKILRGENVDSLVAAAILVASEHRNEDLDQLAEFIQKSGE